MSSESSERRITFITLLNLTTHAMVEELIRRMMANGYEDVRPADHQVFENIDRSGTRLTTLAVRAQMTHQSMSELVASLEKRGYLEREVDPSDRRARLVKLTSRGRDLLRQALKEIEDIETEWLREMGQDASQDVRSGFEQALRAAKYLQDASE